MDPKGIQFIDELQAAADTVALREKLLEHFEALGFSHFAYHVVRPARTPRNLSVVTNYPWAWREQYVDCGYVRLDPVLAASSAATGPVIWKNIKHAPEIGDHQLRMFKELGQYGIRSGATVPIRGAAGSFATLTVAHGGSDDQFGRLWQANKYDIQLIAHYVDELASQWRRSYVDDESSRLTARERECLLWAARGKSASETAAILGVSERTVVFHINNSLRKLDVHTKIHAVVKGVMSGLIVP